jgi:hypothetical protein
VHSEEPHIPKVNASGGAKLLGEDIVYTLMLGVFVM